uniref:Vitrin n=1 Tax=Prolemur simus TaxID=1328070 RepID=A0A8C9A868_PROSS
MINRKKIFLDSCTMFLLVTGIHSNKEMTKKIKRLKFNVPQINCDVKAGKIINPEFIVKCPAGCQDPKYHVYGTDVYASYSSVCGAAVHSGVLDNSGGKILVRKVAGQSGYKGSYSNGVQSLSLPRWRESFIVSESKPQKGVTYPSALTYSSSKSPAGKLVNRQYCVLGDSVEINILTGQAALGIFNLSLANQY